MGKLIQKGEGKSVYKGKTFEVLDIPFEADGKEFSLERVRRSPGVRFLIVKGDKILLTKEYRSELEDYDYRLPGGKVFDSLDEYIEALKSEKDMIEYATEAAKKEAVEETGIIAKDLEFIHETSPGFSVEWELYYFLIKDFEEHPDGQDLEAGEEIEPFWASLEEAKQICLDKRMSEDRSVAVLLRFLLK